ncbi:MAG: hypothetical protein ACLU22_11520 [Clostridium sp.]
MILRYELPKEAEQVISLTDNERIYYAVPVDIDDAGNFFGRLLFLLSQTADFLLWKRAVSNRNTMFPNVSM